MFKPLHDYVVIDKKIQTEKNGIYIPEQYQKGEMIAEVIAVGPGKITNKKFVPTTVKPGEKIVIRESMGQELIIGGKKITLIKEENIIARIIDIKNLKK